MFEIAYLQDPGNGRLRHEEKLVLAECERRGIPVQLYTAKRIQRRQLHLGPHAFICGDADAIHGAVRQLQIPIPECHDYPASLTSYLKRRTWTSDLGSVEQSILNGDSPPLFVKPSARLKSFTGLVVAGPDDFYAIGNTSRREPVWCSEVVTWRSEYRAYVIGEELAGLDFYQGDESVKPCLETIRSALRDYRAAGDAPAAYGIDFGVLSDGETALVEANDGYALGAYHIGAAAYTTLLFTRWAELLESSQRKEIS